MHLPCWNGPNWFSQISRNFLQICNQSAVWWLQLVQISNHQVSLFKDYDILSSWLSQLFSCAIFFWREKAMSIHYEETYYRKSFYPKFSIQELCFYILCPAKKRKHLVPSQIPIRKRNIFWRQKSRRKAIFHLFTSSLRPI